MSEMKFVHTEIKLKFLQRKRIAFHTRILNKTEKSFRQIERLADEMTTFGGRSIGIWRYGTG